MNSRANSDFWEAYRQLPPEIRQLSRKNYRLWQRDQRHPSLKFKKVAWDVWSVRVGRHYRALAAEEQGTWCGFGLVRMTSTSGCSPHCNGAITSRPKPNALAVPIPARESFIELDRVG